ncbi:glucoamylase family protein [Botryobacter ruber]|uniref:glucoamylase family protein n=1 Tax=Botryobacter ruber TaxID=2171629 RepID=UPI000E0A9AB2|nr:glucoamylase family protein [Botryobacter ruber]
MKFRFLLFLTLLLLPGLLLAQKAKSPKALEKFAAQRPKNLSDTALLELVQKQTFQYFWDGAHPNSGLARERINLVTDPTREVVTTGGTGFGIMAIVVAAERGWITREQAAERVLKIANFLWNADSFHGVYSHWIDGNTGKVIRFGVKDDGGDLVETAFLMQGLLTARQYFSENKPVENQLRNRVRQLWENVEWDWHTKDGQDVLYWHWSPNNGWAKNHQVRGWNECLIMYVLAASAPKYAISPQVYHKGWAVNNVFRNGREYYGINLPLGTHYGGPLFFAHYSFLGLDPRGLKDRYANYWDQNKSHTLINRQHCIVNPKGYKGYGENSWGLTASDNHRGYSAHSPTNDLGVITPTAALSSFPYTPEYSMQALKYFYNNLGDKIWSEYGFVDAFSEEHDWYAKTHLAIDQGPIVGMIENYRTGLLWKLFMEIPEIQTGLKRLGFESPQLKSTAGL